jgi:nanoRNase/pAp phosphatase (c-di-AMP/oligoRNAs hydrolase)
MTQPAVTRHGVARHGRSLLDFVRAHRDTLSPLLILMHDFPDPDALAAAYGLRYLAKAAFGIESRIAYHGEPGGMENKAMGGCSIFPLAVRTRLA